MPETQNLTDKEFLLEAWKQSIDVQKHFNELGLKIRNTSITVLGAGLAATGFLVKENYILAINLQLYLPLLVSCSYAVLAISFPSTLYLSYTSIFVKYFYNRGIKWAVLLNSLAVFTVFLILVYFLIEKDELPNKLEVNLGGVCLFALALVTCIFYLLDRYWYHKLLKGAVSHATSVETKLDNLGVRHLDIGKHISKASSVNVGAAKLNSNAKLDLVYLPIIVSLFLISLILTFYGSSVVGKKPVEVAALNQEINSLKKEIEVISANKKATELVLKARVDSIETAFVNFRLQHYINNADTSNILNSANIGNN